MGERAARRRDARGPRARAPCVLAQMAGDPQGPRPAAAAPRGLGLRGAAGWCPRAPQTLASTVARLPSNDTPQRLADQVPCVHTASGRRGCGSPRLGPPASRPRPMLPASPSLPRLTGDVLGELAANTFGPERRGPSPRAQAGPSLGEGSEARGPHPRCPSKLDGVPSPQGPGRLPLRATRPLQTR